MSFLNLIAPSSNYAQQKLVEIIPSRLGFRRKEFSANIVSMSTNVDVTMFDL